MKRPRSSTRRTIRRTGLWGLLAVVLCIIVAVSILLFSARAGRWAVSRAVEWYNLAVPGHVKIGKVEGYLASEISVANIVLSDADGDTLISADALRVAWSPAALFRRKARITKLKIQHATLHLRDKGNRNPFVDLLIPGPSEPSPSPHLGPTLPLAIEAAIEVDGFTLLHHTATGEVTRHVENARVKGRFTGRGAEATLDISHASGLLLLYQLRIERLSFTASWREPSIFVEKLEIVSNRGSVSMDRLTFDVAKTKGRAHLDGVVTEASIADWIAVDSGGDLHLSLDIAGGPSALLVDARLKGDNSAALRIRVRGALHPALNLKAIFDIDNFDVGATAGLASHVAAGKGKVSISGSDFASALIEGYLTCDKCRLASLGEVDADLRVDVKAGTGQWEASVSAVGAEVKASATADKWQIHTVDWKTSVPNLLFTASAMKALMEVPVTHGSLNGAGVCRRTDTSLQCTGQMMGTAVKTPWFESRRLSLDFSLIPTDALLPFTSTLFAQQVTAGKEPLGDVHLAATGNKERIDVQLKGTLRGKERLRAHFAITTSPIAVDLMALTAAYRKLNVRLQRPSRIVIDKDGMSIPNLVLKVADGGVNLNGHLRRKGWSDFHFGVDKLNLGYLSMFATSGSLSGVMSGTGTVRGAPSQWICDANIDIKKLVYARHAIGDVRVEAGYRPHRLFGVVNVNGGFAESLHASFAVGVVLDEKNGTIQLLKSAGDDIRIKTRRLNLAVLSTLFENNEMAGRLDFEGRFERYDQHPKVILHAETQGFVWQKVTFGDSTASVHMEDGRTLVDIDIASPLFGSLQARGDIPFEMDWDTTPKWRYDETHSVVVTAKKIEIAPLAALLSQRFGQSGAPSMPASGRMDLQIDLKGSLVQPKFDVYLDIAALAWNSKKIGDTVIGIDGNRQAVSTHVQIVQAKDRYFDLKASIPISLDLPHASWAWEPRQSHSLEVRFDGVDSALVQPFVILPMGLDFRVKGRLSGKGRFGAFTLNGEWQTRSGLKEFSFSPIEGRLFANQDVQKIRVYTGPVDTPTASLYVETRLPDTLLDGTMTDLNDMPFAAKFHLPDLRLSRFHKLLPDELHDLQGQMTATITATGSLSKPHINGRLSLAKGAVTLTPLNQRIKDIDFTAVFSDRQVTVPNLRFKSGGGRGDGTFRLNYADAKEITAKGNLRLVGFPVVKPGIPEGLVSAMIATEITHTADASAIALTIGDAHFRLFDKSGSQPPKDLPKSSNITFRTKNDEVPKSAASKVNRHAAPSPHQLRLLVKFTDPIEIHGQGVEMRWAGKLSLETVGGYTKVQGGIQALPGRFLLLGNTFEIESGEISFAREGNPDPFINIVAHTRTSEAEVTLVLRGRSAHPDLILRSDPPLSQYQIVSLLLTGKSDPSDSNGKDTNMEAQAASLLLSFNNPELERKIYEKLGIDRATVTVGQTVEEPVVTLGKRVGKRIYVETQYHHNAPQGDNEASGSVQYRFSDGWSLETSYGDAQKGEVGVFWQKRFDGRKEKTKEKPTPSPKKGTPP